MPISSVRASALASATLAAAALTLLAVAATAQTPDSGKGPPPDTTTRSTGLPMGGTWTFNLDAGAGYFSFGQSLYANTRPEGVPANTGANWAEGYVRPAISAVYPGADGAEFYGKLAVVGEKTYAAPPPLVGSDASSYGLENLYIGWRSGKSMKMGENALDFTVGMAPYKIGQGLLLWDGGAEGGARGGYWSNARQAWQYAGIGRFNADHNTVELFWLQRNDLPGHNFQTRVWGLNYQYALGEHSTFGLTYAKLSSDSLAYRNGEALFNLRAFTTPISSLPHLSILAEVAKEKNSGVLNSFAWYVQASYGITEKGWKPTVSYRYAFFEGDDPGTTTSESFDPLFTGFYDWGTWWQGEIAGEYFLLNSNLISHELRLSLVPGEQLSSGLIAYEFLLDRKPVGITSSSLAFEIDAYTDWKINSNFTTSFILAYANPQKAVQEEFNRTQNMWYGMVYVAYSY